MARQKTKKQRPLYATEAEWDHIRALAKSDGREVSPFIIHTLTQMPLPDAGSR